MSEFSKVNVRELRQNLSVYLRRVKAGETLEVAERGEPVALLVPLPRSESRIDRLIAEGLVTPATLRYEDLGPPLEPEPGFSISAALEDMKRED